MTYVSNFDYYNERLISNNNFRKFILPREKVIERIHHLEALKQNDQRKKIAKANQVRVEEEEEEGIDWNACLEKDTIKVMLKFLTFNFLAVLLHGFQNPQNY